MSEEPEIDFSKLSIEERCNHKNWKARVSAYDDLTNLFQTQTDDKSNEFAKYAPIVKKFVVDANAAAQEKGLSAVLSFVENYANSGRTADGVISGIIGKCLISPKVKTRELANDIILMYVEIEKHETVIEELIKGLDNKTPKVVSACTVLIRECLKHFGVKVINVKPIVKIISRLLEDRDKNIRDEGKALAVEVYRWIKDAIKPQLINLKPVQLQELETAFEKVKDERASPIRYLRSQQIREVEETVANHDQVDNNPVTAVDDVAIDPFDLIDPVDILSKLPSDFYELCEAKKWQERKEALETLAKLIDENPKLQSGDYADLVRQLKKFIGKDTNVVVVALAAKCLGGLAKGLRKAFHPYANSSISVIIEKFKEKKTAVVQALREAIDSAIVATSLDAILEDITNALDNKNPQIKSETALFLSRVFANTHPTVLGNKKLLKPLCDALMKSLNDMDVSVRDASAEALGTAMKVVSEKAITPFIQGIDPIKLTKVKEYCEKAVVKVAASNAPPPAPKSTAVKRPVTTAPPPKPPSSVGSSSRSASNEDLNIQKKTIPKKGPVKSAPIKSQMSMPNGQSARVTSKPDAEPKQSAIAKGVPKGRASRPSLSAGGRTSSKKDEDIVSKSPLMHLNKLKDQRFADEKALKVLKWNFETPRDEFYEQLKEQMIAADWQMTLITYCFHADFKFHIKAIDMMRDFLASGNVEVTFANCDLILKWIALRFFDTNPSVILKALEYLLVIFDAYCRESRTLTDVEANSFMPYLVRKSGDPKDAVRNKVHDIMAKMRDIYPPQKIFVHLMTGLRSKNARQRAMCLEELAALIETCGMSVCQPSPSAAIEEIAKCIADRDNSVRNASLNCVVQVYYIEQEKVYKYVGQLSDKESSLLEERIKRASKSRLTQIPPQSAPVPISTATITRKDRTPEKSIRMHSPSPPLIEPTPEVVRPINTTPPKSIPKQRPKSMGPLNFEQNEYSASGGRERHHSPRDYHNNTLTYESRMSDHYNRPEPPVEDEIGELLKLPDVKLRKRLVPSATGSLEDMINLSQNRDVALNLVMAQLSSQDIKSALEALSHLSGFLDHGTMADTVLDSKVDHVVIMCYMQYRLFFTKHLADESLPNTEAVRLFRGVTKALMSLFKKESLASKVSRDVLKELMSHIISLLTDPKVNQLSDNTNINRSLNNLVSSIITHSDMTNILSALIKLLHDCMNSMNISSKFTEMVMKCVWRISRNLESSINSVDIERILLDVHLFLKTFPAQWWRDGDKSDTPLRTVKTLTYLIVQYKGEDVYNYLNLIHDRDESELYHYIQKALKQRGVLQKPLNKNPVKSFNNKDIHTQLSSIISRLRTDESALNDLYEFNQKNPQISFESYFDNSTEQFRNYVFNGLQKIKAEKSTPESARNNENLAFTASDTPHIENLTTNNVIEWYKSIADRLRIDSSKFEDPEFLSRAINENQMSLSEMTLAVQQAQENLENFKRLCADHRQNKLNL